LNVRTAQRGRKDGRTDAVCVKTNNYYLKWEAATFKSTTHYVKVVVGLVPGVVRRVKKHVSPRLVLGILIWIVRGVMKTGTD
jgi:hypothetical protein